MTKAGAKNYQMCPSTHPRSLEEPSAFVWFSLHGGLARMLIREDTGEAPANQVSYTHRSER